MLAVNQAKKLIDGAHISGIDHVYAFNIPSEVVENTDLTLIRLSDVNQKPQIWGSDDFGALNREVEVQIFYKQDPDVDPEVLESRLFKLFVHHDWELGEVHGHTFDTDTSQLTCSFYVYNMKYL